MSGTVFKVGMRVDRIEDREITGATIIGIQSRGESVTEATYLPDDYNMMDMISAEIAYDEGGTGWWPLSCLRPIPEVTVE